MPVSGMYVATHPWLTRMAKEYPATEDIVKIGHSGRLGDRLYDSAYTTCWSVGWTYKLVLETADKDDAERLETFALDYMARSALRIDDREIVRITSAANVDTLVAATEEYARHNGITWRRVLEPEYAKTPGPHVADVEKNVLEGKMPPAPSAVIPAGITGEADELQAAVDAMALQFQNIAITSAASVPLGTPPQESITDNIFPGGVVAAGDDGEETVDLPDYVPSERAALPPVEEREYQTEAVAACLRELEKSKRATLLMACRCGKTRVAHMVMQKYIGKGAVLFLVPWLALIRQIVDKLCSYGVDPKSIIMVGSGIGNVTMTTDVGVIQKQLEANAAESRPSVVVSTYLSSAVATDPVLPPYALTVFDECHHVCGPVDARASNHVLLAPLTGGRLFMTATPVVAKGVCKTKTGERSTIHMGDRALFGGVAYRYHLRQGIDAGYVNSFELQLVASSTDAVKRIDAAKSMTAPTEPQRIWKRFLSIVASAFRGKEKTLGDLGTNQPIEHASAGAGETFMATQVVLAYDHLTSDLALKRNKLLVFCRTIEQAERLRDQVAQVFRAVAAGGAKVEIAAKACLVAVSSRTPKDVLEQELERFYDPEIPVILFNCKLFQEGIEFPPLNGVFFATPRHSARDIIQSMCRALTRVAGKARSVVYIPVPPAIFGASVLSRFETILPFAEAIYSEDPRFYEHLLDPDQPYPIGWLGVHGGVDTLLHSARRAIRYGTGGPNKAGRLVDRLTKNDMIPWDVAFAELENTTKICRRYPKGNDGFTFSLATELGPDPTKTTKVILNFGSWYTWAQKEYVKHASGAGSSLQPHQVADLERLPMWKTRGVGSPYPPAECLATLERMLESTGGKMLPININNGGWIGLDSTNLEQLSGFLTTISQQDGRCTARGKSPKRGFIVLDAKAKELDRIFGKWGVKWRKDRKYSAGDIETAVARAAAQGRSLTEEAAAAELRAAGVVGYLVTNGSAYAGEPTAIQAAHTKFAEIAREDPNNGFIQSNWPGYPEKHAHMEHTDVWAGGLAPPRVSRNKAGERQLTVRAAAPEA
jgi:superfamily II DNA or RNA helicase